MIEPSPCVRICVIDPVTTWCIGCGRTGAEIADWLCMTNPDRAALKSQLADRMRTMTRRDMRKREARHAG
jgi:predicted Fe-S protein YdhL (DUF1289 family)